MFREPRHSQVLNHLRASRARCVEQIGETGVNSVDKDNNCYWKPTSTSVLEADKKEGRPIKERPSFETIDSFLLL